MFNLFATRRFLPLFVTQFFGAFNDNFLKIAIVTLFTFNLDYSTELAAILTNLAMALFIGPYFIFSAFAGELTDAFEKSRICRMVKLVEIILMIAATVGFLITNIPMLLVLLCFMGVQSTFFGPAKYSLLPQQLADNELVAGNSFIEGGTFLAILTGTLFGATSITLPHGELVTGGVLIVLAIVGYISSCYIPIAPPARKLRSKISLNIFTSSFRIIKYGLDRPKLKGLIIPISFFWLIGSLFISQIPTLCRTVLGANSTVNTILFMTFSVGVAIGSLAANRLLKGKISTRLAVPSAIIMAIATIDLALATQTHATNTTLLSASQAFQNPQTWHIVFTLIVISVVGGLYSVPLQACLQHQAPAGFVARVIACNNIINSFFMAIGAGAVALAVMLLHLSISSILFGVAALCLIMARSCAKTLLQRGNN